MKPVLAQYPKKPDKSPKEIWILNDGTRNTDQDTGNMRKCPHLRKEDVLFANVK